MRLLLIEARAPCRVDLAGGTCDLYPLYLLLEGAVVVSLGVTLHSTARLSTRRDSTVTMRSLDGTEHVAAPSWQTLPADGPLRLAALAVRHARPPTGLDVELHSEVPRGSGLGASSALLLALLAALDRLRQPRADRQRLIALAADLEAQALGVPTGRQDHVAAAFGGLQAIRFGPGVPAAREVLEPPAAFGEALRRRLVLAYTSVPHDSAALNWTVLRSCIERTGAVREHLRAVRDAAEALLDAVRRGDEAAFAAHLAEEWLHRRALAPGIATTEVDAALRAAASAGALAGKVCGAGGGGCVAVWAAPGRTDAVRQALQAAGAQVIPFTPARRGLTVRARP